MFGSMDWRPRGSVALREVSCYFAQLAFSYPATAFASILVTPLLARLGFGGDERPGIHFAGNEVLACLLMGSVIGWAVGRFKPSFLRTGCWIWIIPVAILVREVRWESRHTSLAAWPDFIFATGGETGLGIVLFTLPACGAVGYSLGMAFLGVNDRWPPATKLRSVLRFAVVLLAAAAGLYFLEGKLRDFEHATIACRANIRRVIMDAVQVSQDPKIFCEEYERSERLPLLPRGTVVEKVDRRACMGDEVVAANTQPPRTRDHYSLVGVEKIRVVEGIDTGLEGWVLVSGLSNTE